MILTEKQATFSSIFNVESAYINGSQAQFAKGANITRRSVAKILHGLRPAKMTLYKNNPEEFIRKIVNIIREQKATMIVEHIHYNMTDGQYDSSIFTAVSQVEFTKAYEAKKHITDYVVTDSEGERDFAHDLDEANEVVVYAKSPRSFQIPTPVGSYAPDWAIAMTHYGVKFLYCRNQRFVAKDAALGNRER